MDCGLCERPAVQRHRAGAAQERGLGELAVLPPGQGDAELPHRRPSWYVVHPPNNLFFASRQKFFLGYFFVFLHFVRHWFKHRASQFDRCCDGAGGCGGGRGLLQPGPHLPQSQAHQPRPGHRAVQLYQRHPGGPPLPLPGDTGHLSCPPSGDSFSFVSVLVHLTYFIKYTKLQHRHMAGATYLVSKEALDSGRYKWDEVFTVYV